MIHISALKPNASMEGEFMKRWATEKREAIQKSLLTCVICGFCLVTACFPQPRGTPALQPATAQRIYRAPFDRVWDVSLAVVTEDLKYPLEIVERDKGMIATQWVTFEKKIGNFRQSEISTEISPPMPMLVSYRVMVMVKITPDGTMVQVRRYCKEWTDHWIFVTSDLQFERQFMLLVDKRLGLNP